MPIGTNRRPHASMSKGKGGKTDYSGMYPIIGVIVLVIYLCYKSEYDIFGGEKKVDRNLNNQLYNLQNTNSSVLFVHMKKKGKLYKKWQSINKKQMEGKEKLNEFNKVF